jgi:hypothetical protein
MVISLRIPDELGYDIRLMATKANRSVNKWIEIRLTEAVNAGIAQRIEQAPSKSQVAGSTPAPSPKILRKDVPGRITNPEIVERAVDAGLRSGHDTKTCHIYGCLMCKALKA